jgi:hypothetical protein
MGKIGEVSYSIYLMHWPIISALCFLLGGILKTPFGLTPADGSFLKPRSAEPHDTKSRHFAPRAE